MCYSHFSCFHTISLISLLVIASTVYVVKSSEQRNRFELYWNVPTGNCKNLTDKLLQTYGFYFNAKQNFTGDKVNTIYEEKIGIYPFYNITTKPPTAVRGGLPQNVSLDEHLKKATEDIEKLIPENFTGIAILDFEAWRPQYDMNWSSKRIYRNASMDLLREQNSSFSGNVGKPYTEEENATAAIEFNKAAIDFMVKTVNLSINLRPNARWGFYGFPYCNYDAGGKGEYECSDEFKEYNNRLAELLLNHTTALFPSIYLKNDTDTSLNFRYIHAILNETKRIASKFDPVKPVYVYTKFEYDPFKNITWLYNEADLCSSVKQVSDFGFQGIIVWSTSRGMNESRCNAIAKYFNNTYGPYAKSVKENANKCDEEKCSKHGQCVTDSKKQCEKSYDEQVNYEKANYNDYRCECDSEFKGDSCKEGPYSTTVAQ